MIVRNEKNDDPFDVITVHQVLREFLEGDCEVTGVELWGLDGYRLEMDSKLQWLMMVVVQGLALGVVGVVGELVVPRSSVCSLFF
jgi:hypothetical protein